MKSFLTAKISASILSAIGFFTLFVPGAGLASESTVAEKPDEIPIQALFVPPVFHDDNDDVIFVIQGQLPVCHRLLKTVVEHQSATRIRIHQFSQRWNSSNTCAATAPSTYTREINMGKMKATDYDLRYLLPSGELGFKYLRVTEAKTPTVDDLLYASVEQVVVPDEWESGRSMEIEIRGNLNDSCTMLLGVGVKEMQDTFVLEPTIYRRPNTFCAEVITPFQEKVSLGKIEAGLYLIQVRGMHGQSFNNVVRVLSPAQ